MIALDRSAVRIGAKPSNKIEAIRQVGQVLVHAGNIEPGYIESMLARHRSDGGDPEFHRRDRQPRGARAV
jgi:mannitol/fructose-specific phosphotransferase system IIA component